MERTSLEEKGNTPQARNNNDSHLAILKAPQQHLCAQLAYKN